MSRRGNQSLAPQKALLNLLDQMRASYQVYQDSHWTVTGNDYYGNHLMLQRIYEETSKEIDGLAEMMVGSYGPEIIQEHRNDTSMWVEVFTDAANPMAGALRAAQEVRMSIDSAYKAMEEHGELGRGWDDFLMALAQEKDTHLYLLQQATDTPAQYSPYAEERAANPVRKLKAKLLR